MNPRPSKAELENLCNFLPHEEAVEACIAFVEVESFGLWHGRARAKMCRRLKHCRLTEWQRYRLVQAILGRLASGNFSEQFKDQLQLAIHLDPASCRSVASTCLHSTRGHVRRYAQFVLNRLASRLPVS